jgi:hypothetical protein
VDPNDYWAHVGLVTVFFVTVVGPRLLSPGHTANSLTYIVGSLVVLVVATVARRRTRPEPESVREERS